MGDRFENTAIIETPDLDDYIRLVTKEGGTRRALASELAKKIVEEYEGSELGGEERTIQAAIADAKQVASEALEEEQEAREAADTAINTDLAKKAYSDGEYADLHAGTANQILSDTYTTDEEPYHYRQTPSHAGTREIDSIVGGSVVWNQVVNTSTSSVTVTSGHKYVAKISDAWSVGASTGTALSVTGGTDMVFDITQMFPTAIADHIYNLEQATAGAGVEFFRKYFPEEYYAYDAGTMRSVEGLVSHNMVGFNQWDEEWENGYITATGAMGSNATSIRSKNFCKCLPNTIYFCTNPAIINVCWYDSAQTFISRVEANGRNITSPANAHYFKVSAYGYGTTYNHNICINFSDPSKNGTYEPYSNHSYSLDSTVTLRGIPQLVDGKLKWNGDIYPPSGLISRRYRIVDLGTLPWSRMSESYQYGTFSATWSGMKYDTSVNTFLCTKYEASNNNTVSASSDNVIWNRSGAVVVKDTSKASMTAADFKTAMSGQYLVYELATPTTEQAEPYQELQICSPYGTEEYVSTGIVPIGHYTKYPTDLKGIVEQIADAPETDGTYTLKATVSGGKVTYSWESA